MHRTVAALLVSLAATAISHAQSGRTGYYRQPALAADAIVFVSEGDLWRVDRGGGTAMRLTAHPGEESHPAISPDGQTVAFLASYEGPSEVYTMPIAGGRPVRQTFDGWTSWRRHTVAGWTPDGDVLVSTFSHATLPNAQLVAIDPNTHERTRIELFQAADGAYSDDGDRLFFVRIPFNGSQTKRYEGGTIEQLWRFDGPGNEAVPLTTEFDGTSREPMVHNNRLYHLTDRSGFMNIWSCNADGSDLRQHTDHDAFDVMEASEYEGVIAYRIGADIKLLDTRTSRITDVDITLSTDFDHTREQWVDEPFQYLTWAEPSPDGDRVALTARGEVFVAPVGPGRLVRATRQPGVRYRQARFTPEGDELFVMSDESGEVEFWTLPADGVGDERTQLTDDATILLWRAELSPDGQTIAYSDKDYKLWIRPIDGGEPTFIDQGGNWYTDEFVWSDDSRYLAYTIQQNASSHGRIGLYDTQTGERTDVTTLRYNSYAPAFHPSGEWLYLVSERNFSTAVGSPWGPRQPEPFYDTPCYLYAVALQPGLRSPFLETNEVFQAQDKEDKEDKDTDTDAEGEGKGGADEDSTQTSDAAQPASEADAEASDSDADDNALPEIVTQGLSERLYTLPLPAGVYANLSLTDTHVFYTSVPSYAGGPTSLMALKITNEPRNEPVTVAANIASYSMTGDRSKLLIRQGNALYMVPASGAPATLNETTRIDLSRWAFSFDPREQWRQMFTDSWRLMRDYFYDRGLHGVDWDDAYQRYLPLVDRVTDRQELADAIAQMVAELSALHTFVYGGDRRTGPDRFFPANLACEAQRDEDAGGYRITHLYQNDPEEPERAGPLMRHDLDINVGDTITMIDGVPTLDATDLGELLRNKIGQQTLVRFAPADGEPYDAIVYPISQGAAADLRYHEWQYTRRQRVEERSGGKIGYVHLRAMGAGNMGEWARHYYGVFDRQGLIVDVRHNNGGNIDSWILNRLIRPAWFYWDQRNLPSKSWNMQQAFRGHKAMLIDEETASDGEAVAEGFRRLGLGKLIGMRTWGGGIWLTSSNVLVDGGIATAAEFGVYGPEGAWIIEGRGVSPDIEIDNLPHETFHGADAQLDTAIDHLLELIAEDPREVPDPPAGKDLSWPRADWPPMSPRRPMNK
ncbi:MAG: S41 family peptidase [Phycisphaerales bacterium]